MRSREVKRYLLNREGIQLRDVQSAFMGHQILLVGYLVLLMDQLNLLSDQFFAAWISNAPVRRMSSELLPTMTLMMPDSSSGFMSAPG